MAAQTALIVLAAGKGTRTRLPLAKVLLPICGRTLLEYVLDTAADLASTEAPAHCVVVLHHGMDEIQARLGARFEEQGCLVVDQGEPKGTGHAVQVALEALDESLGAPFEGKVLVLYGDAPLIPAMRLRELLSALDEADLAASLLSCETLDPEGMGRILRDDDGVFMGIREAKDCSDDELLVDEVNTGFCAFRSEALRSALPRLATDNSQAELYLTDVFGLLVQEGKLVDALLTPFAEEVVGINTLVHLAEARKIVQDDILYGLLEDGVYIEDPSTTIIEKGVEIGRGTHVLPHTVIRSGVKVGKDCEVGPFTHLRAGAVLEDGAEVGNFVEMKKSVLGAKSKAKHLTYLGDAVIGKGANIGAGTITANYDGKNKFVTKIADKAFIGSGCILVAPSEVGEGAITGAGALVTRNTSVPPGEVYVGVPAKPIRKKSTGESSASTSGGEG